MYWAEWDSGDTQNIAYLSHQRSGALCERRL
jgi:hypothetical protein